MKRLFFVSALLFTIGVTMSACSLSEGEVSPESDPERGVEPGDFSIEFTDATIVYYEDFYDSGTGNYTIELSETGPHGEESLNALLYLDCFSKLLADEAEVGIATGTYVNSLSMEEFTFWDSVFNHESFLGDLYVREGDFTIRREGDIYRIEINFVLNNGQALTGSYTGEILFVEEIEQSTSD